MDLTDSFVDFYSHNIHRIHPRSTKEHFHIYTEFQVSGYGIPDVLVFLSDDANTNQLNNSVVRAFEIKISDWRKALMQAARYKYFSNVATVVLPYSKTNAPRKYLETFKMLKVGLWGFDEEKRVLHKFYTPRPTKALSEKTIAKVISDLSAELV